MENGRSVLRKRIESGTGFTLEGLMRLLTVGQKITTSPPAPKKLGEYLPPAANTMKARMNKTTAMTYLIRVVTSCRRGGLASSFNT